MGKIHHVSAFIFPKIIDDLIGDGFVKYYLILYYEIKCTYYDFNAVHFIRVENITCAA